MYFSIFWNRASVRLPEVKFLSQNFKQELLLNHKNMRLIHFLSSNNFVIYAANSVLLIVETGTRVFSKLLTAIVLKKKNIHDHSKYSTGYSPKIICVLTLASFSLP